MRPLETSANFEAHLQTRGGLLRTIARVEMTMSQAPQGPRAKVVRVAIRAVTEVARLRRASAASCRSAATFWEGAGWKILPPAMRSLSWRLEAQVTYSVGGERFQVSASQLLRRPATWKGQGKVKQSCLCRAQPRLCMTDVAVVAFGPDERGLEQSHTMSYIRVLRRGSWDLVVPPCPPKGSFFEPCRARRCPGSLAQVRSCLTIYRFDSAKTHEFIPLLSDIKQSENSKSRPDETHQDYSTRHTRTTARHSTSSGSAWATWAP